MADDLNPRLCAAVKEFSVWWDRRLKKISAADAVREPLFHYTNMAGLLGILTSEEMWFTSIFHLNDPSELAHGFAMARRTLTEEAQREHKIAQYFCAVMMNLLDDAPTVFLHFIGSFSRASNDLGQWRAYADNARGVAIGFSPKLFQIVENSDELSLSEKTFVARVDYDPANCARNFQRAVRHAVGIAVRNDCYVRSDAERKRFVREMTVQLAPPLIWYSSTSKHAAYAHEQETRLIIVNDREKLDPITRTRARRSNLVPYIPSPFRVREKGALMKIMVGPAADRLAENAVQSLLASHGLPPDIVERSDIPYTAL